MDNKYYLGVDIGSISTKGVVIDGNNNIIASKYLWTEGGPIEATKKVIDFFFKEVGMNRIYAWHADGNPASGRMQEKAGMKYEGTLRQAGKCNAGIYDKIVYAILAEDYFAEDAT